MFTKRRLMFIIIVVILIVLGCTALFIIYRTQFFEFTIKHFAICPKEPVVCDMRKLEEIVSCEKYSNVIDPSNSDFILVGRSLEESPYLLTKLRIEYMFVDTREDLRGGVINYGEPLVNKYIKAPTGFYFKYPLQGLLKVRTYSKRIWTRPNEYINDEKLDSKLKSYGSAVYPKPRNN